MFARYPIRFQILGGRQALSWAHGLSTVAVAVASAVLLGACGQKGPLFFPPPPKQASTAAVPAAPAGTAPAVITTDIPQPPPAAPSTVRPLPPQ